MTYRLARFTTAAVALVLSGAAHGVPLTARQQRPPAAAGLDVRKFDAIEALVRDEIGQKRLPGAVVLIGVGDRIVYQKAIGNRALVPSAEPMTLDTMFDVASLTKVVATTTSVMMLIEQGKLRLVDRVATFIPGFERYGKADITIRHLLTHVSGLRPDVDLDDVGRHRRRHSAGCRGSADGTARHPLRLQRHQLLSARRDRPAGQRPAARRVHAGARLQAARHERHDVQSAGVAAAADRADGELHAVRLAVRRPGPPDAARRRSRSDRAADERRRRPRGVVQHRRRPGDLLPHAARRRLVPRRADPRAADGGEDDHAGAGERGSQRACARLGRRLQLFGQPRRAAADRIVRAHRLHGHVALDRSGDADVRRVPVQPRPSRWQGGRHPAPGAGGDNRRVGDRRRCRRVVRTATLTGRDFGGRRR